MIQHFQHHDTFEIHNEFQWILYHYDVMGARGGGGEVIVGNKLASNPGLTRPDFISQPWRKIGIKSGRVRPGFEASNKWGIYIETCKFLCFHVQKLHESTKTCTFSSIFSIYCLLLPQYIILVKGLYRTATHVNC